MLVSIFRSFISRARTVHATSLFLSHSHSYIHSCCPFARTFPSICSTFYSYSMWNVRIFFLLFFPSIYSFLCEECSFFLSLLALLIVVRSIFFFLCSSCRCHSGYCWCCCIMDEREYFILSIIYKIDVICIIAWVSYEWNRKPSQNYSISTIYKYMKLSIWIFLVRNKCDEGNWCDCCGCCCWMSVFFVVDSNIRFLITYQSQNPSHFDLDSFWDFGNPTLWAGVCVCVRV